MTTPEVVLAQNLKYFAILNTVADSISDIRQYTIEPLFISSVCNTTTQRRDKMGTSTQAMTEVVSLIHVKHGEELPASE